MTIPEEFTSAHVEVQSGEDAFTPYRAFLRSREPYTSILRNNPSMLPPRPGEPLTWGEGRYYDTTVARKHDHWKDIDLPRPTKDISRLRRDIYEWGFCLIEDGLSAEQLAVVKQRVEKQADAERLAGLITDSPALQLVWALINKGRCFVQCLELDPEGVQAGPLIEQLLDEALGKGWCSYSFLSNIAFAGCHPQMLHQDQTAIHPWLTPEAPILMNVVYLLDDVNEVNGGTLMIPGSHKTVSGSGGTVGKLPPAINTEAKAGTVLMMDGRLLHGTGVNRTEKQRIILTNSNVKPWLRTQENWMLTVRPEVLADASPKLLARLGFQASTDKNLTEGFGAMGNGRAGDPRGAIVKFRQAIDAGEMVHVGELTPELVRSRPDFNWTHKAVKDALSEQKEPGTTAY